jgi:hypothetical protein
MRVAEALNRRKCGGSYVKGCIITGAADRNFERGFVKVYGTPPTRTFAAFSPAP